MSVVGVSQVQGRVPITVLHLKDRINMGNTAEVEQAARQAYDQGVRHLLIDLTDAPSITSAGLRTILVIYRLLEGSSARTPSSADAAEPAANSAGASPASASPPRSAHLKLLNPTPEVRRILEIAGFDRYFEVHMDLQKALASF